MRLTLLALPITLLAACGGDCGSYESAASCLTEPTSEDARDATSAELAHQAAIRNAISRDAKLRPSSKLVHISTVRGRVTLRGTVATAADRERIEDLVRGCSATREIDSSIQVERA